MLLDTVKTDLVAAMKSGQALKLSVLRMVSSELNYRKIEVQRELTDEDVVVVLNKEAKKRREAIASYNAANRPEQAKKEEEELAILQAYLPALMSEEEVRAELAKMDLPGDFGGAMRVAAPIFKGRAEGGMVAEIVRQVIQ